MSLCVEMLEAIQNASLINSVTVASIFRSLILSNLSTL